MDELVASDGPEQGKTARAEEQAGEAPLGDEGEWEADEEDAGEPLPMLPRLRRRHKQMRRRSALLVFVAAAILVLTSGLSGGGSGSTIALSAFAPLVLAPLWVRLCAWPPLAYLTGDAVRHADLHLAGLSRAEYWQACTRPFFRLALIPWMLLVVAVNLAMIWIMPVFFVIVVLTTLAGTVGSLGVMGTFAGLRLAGLQTAPTLAGMGLLSIIMAICGVGIAVAGFAHPVIGLVLGLGFLFMAAIQTSLRLERAAKAFADGPG